VSAFVDAGTPGVTDCDLRRMPYEVLQGVWPLDRDASPPSTSIEETT
jgi:hypothetical protein